MVAADIGKLDWAYNYFLKTAKIDIEAKYKVYVGTIFMGGSHPAANGGAWMTAVFGFGGVKAGQKGRSPSIRDFIKNGKALQFNMVYKGDRFNIKITKDEVAIMAAVVESNANRHLLCLGKSINCAPGTAKSAVKNYPANNRC